MSGPVVPDTLTATPTHVGTDPMAKTPRMEQLESLLADDPAYDHGLAENMAPLIVRLFDRYPLLRRIPGRLIGLGVSRERVRSPAASPRP